MHSEQFLIGKDEQAHLKKKIKKKSTGTINKVSKFFLKNLIYPELLLLKKGRALNVSNLNCFWFGSVQQYTFISPWTAIKVTISMLRCP